MTTKTHKTAVVLIPPEEVWGPIQEIRRRHDRNVRRWMPHITLLYPFRPSEKFDAVVGPLEEASRTVEPFRIRLAEFDRFDHGRDNFTVWLKPAPAEPVCALQAALQAVAPDCDDVIHDGRFVPHLSVGQARGRRNVERLMESLRPAWQGVEFPADRVSLLHRSDDPEDVFQLARTFPLAGESAEMGRRGAEGAEKEES